MGFDHARFMENLFLYFYENKWLVGTKKKHLQNVHLFSNLFRFIDDLCVIKYHLYFEKNFKDIYPSELQLKKEIILIPEGSFKTFQL